jgi:hypothetical protein
MVSMIAPHMKPATETAPTTATETETETTIIDMDEALRVDHPLIRSVDRAIFRLAFVADCTRHRCLCRDDGDRPRLDACCQHGADVLLGEKSAILRRVSEIAAVMQPDRRDPAAWFDEREPEVAPEPPFETVIRTATTDLDVDDSGCVFLQHTGARGCGLHFAALQHGFDPAEIKPSVCRLYPLALDEGRLGLNPDFDRYSCARSGDATIYAVMRDALGEMFGPEVVRLLDDHDARLRLRRPRGLALMTDGA